MDANLFLFQTVIVGDDWGELAVPLIQTYPATACIFVGSFLTIVFGVLNLIMALVVHSFQDNDRASEVEADRRTLANLFAHLETDQSGQSQERDLDDSDLQMLFEMIDWDGRGAIEASDFVSCLSCFAHDSKRTPRFIKYNFMQSMRSQEDLYASGAGKKSPPKPPKPEISLPGWAILCGPIQRCSDGCSSCRLTCLKHAPLGDLLVQRNGH
ncbi:unnamed protein product [Durusdinium trenchii]|uniref:EF-hand domain-containing protein n=1 Tax=Durusdinium trenchii TaxID=1381693 RepID=A0ABP0PJA1_9DINO